jgi:hypothetical protein
MDFVKIKDKEYPVYFGWNALRTISAKTGCTAHTIRAHFGIRYDWTITTAHVGLLEGARKSSYEGFDRTEEELADLIDDDPGAILRLAKSVASQFEQLMSEPGDDEKNVKAPQRAGEKPNEATG